LSLGSAVQPAVVRFEDIKAGHSWKTEATFNESQIDAFAAITGDHNPIHMDELHARAQGYRGRVVHGVLVAGVISRIIGMQIPGRDSLLISISMDFVVPICAGDVIGVSCEIIQTQISTKTVRIAVRLSVRDALAARATVIAKFTKEETEVP
jgi:3-hydroxybutyryl-CoA dehydratase